jgi:hypothetical protein
MVRTISLSLVCTLVLHDARVIANAQFLIPPPPPPLAMETSTEVAGYIPVPFLLHRRADFCIHPHRLALACTALRSAVLDGE